MSSSKHKDILLPVFAVLVFVGLVFLTMKEPEKEDTQVPERITVKGELECLPHRNAGDFVTMECAFGLLSKEGLHYGLNTALLSSTDTAMKLQQTGEEITVEGPFVSASEDTSGISERYAVEGVIWVTSAY